MTTNGPPRHHCLLMLGWCMAILSTQWVFGTQTQAQELDASYLDDDYVLFVATDLEPDVLYEIVIDRKSGDVPTGIMMRSPDKTTVKVYKDGTPATSSGGYQLQPTERYWLRRHQGGRVVGPYYGESGGSTSIITRDERTGWFHWLFGQVPPSSPEPFTVVMQQPMELASVAPLMGGALQQHRGYGAGTTITITLDPDQASWCDEEVDVQGTGAMVSVGEHAWQFTITENWSVESDNVVEVAGMGIHVNPDTPWIDMQTVKIGRFDSVITDADQQVVHASFGEPGTTISSTETLRVPAVPNRGDTNGNRVVDLEDLLLVVYAYGKDAAGSEADTNLDGTVGIHDLLDVLANWGEAA